MNSSQIKLELFRRIDSLDNSALAKLYEYVISPTKESADFWEELSPAQKADIEAGLKDLGEGKKKDIRKVLEKYKKK